MSLGRQLDGAAFRTLRAFASQASVCASLMVCTGCAGKSKVEKLHQHALHRACAQHDSHRGGQGQACTRRCAAEVSDAAFLRGFHLVLTELLDDIVMSELSPS